VYATARKLSSMKECEKAGARLLELDITVASSIKSAVAKIIAEAGRIGKDPNCFLSSPPVLTPPPVLVL